MDIATNQLQGMGEFNAPKLKNLVDENENLVVLASTIGQSLKALWEDRQHQDPLAYIRQKYSDELKYNKLMIKNFKRLDKLKSRNKKFCKLNPTPRGSVKFQQESLEKDIKDFSFLIFKLDYLIQSKCSKHEIRESGKAISSFYKIIKQDSDNLNERFYAPKLSTIQEDLNEPQMIIKPMKTTLSAEKFDGEKIITNPLLTKNKRALILEEEVTSSAPETPSSPVVRNPIWSMKKRPSLQQTLAYVRENLINTREREVLPETPMAETPADHEGVSFESVREIFNASASKPLNPSKNWVSRLILWIRRR